MYGAYSHDYPSFWILNFYAMSFAKYILKYMDVIKYIIIIDIIIIVCGGYGK